MAALLKSESSAELVQQLVALEDLADDCFKDLELLRVPRNLASWAALTRLVQLIEPTIEKFGTPYTREFLATIINAGRSGSLLLEWIRKHGSARLAPRSRFRWSVALERTAAQAFDLAHNYEVFTGCFPAWHRDRAAAEIVAPRTVRFTWIGGAVGRRVSAFQKGFRPESGERGTAIPSSPVPDTPATRDRLARVLETCRPSGPRGFSYPEPRAYHEYLMPFYERSLASVFRREDSLDLGKYTLSTFKSLYVALLAICATHEILCHWWGKGRGKYPLNSAVIVREHADWVDTLSRLSGQHRDVVEAIVDDLTFPVGGPRKPQDLLIHPFVPLDAGSRLLGILPHFPLYSRPDENILRTCSYISPAAYHAASQLKERDMRSDLVSGLPAHVAFGGPVKLPGGNPDLDLILEDHGSSTLVLAELKWIRKPLSVLERCDRDEEFLKGVDQLRRIEGFLSGNPEYLFERGKVSRSMSDYSEVRYLLLARDHFVWVDPAAEYPVIEFEAFKRAVCKAATLHDALAELLEFEWLPVEGRDFAVSFQVARANGVSIESEIFLPVRSASPLHQAP
jgi:hypothetical protein